MSFERDFVLDEDRTARIGISEAVYCAGKSAFQIASILDYAAAKSKVLLLTRLDTERFGDLPEHHKRRMDYDAISRTGFSRPVSAPPGPAQVAT